MANLVYSRDKKVVLTAKLNEVIRDYKYWHYTRKMLGVRQPIGILARMIQDHSPIPPQKDYPMDSFSCAFNAILEGEQLTKSKEFERFAMVFLLTSKSRPMTLTQYAETVAFLSNDALREHAIRAGVAYYNRALELEQKHLIMDQQTNEDAIAAFNPKFNGDNETWNWFCDAKNGNKTKPPVMNEQQVNCAMRLGLLSVREVSRMEVDFG